MIIRKKLFRFQNFQEIIFFACTNSVSFFDDGAHCEANFAEIFTTLIKVLTGQPLILSLVKQLQHRNTENSLFPPEFKFFLGSFASDIDKDYLIALPVQCKAKRFIQKGLYMLPKDSKNSYFPLKFMYIVR